MSNPAPSFFVTGGTLRPDAECYVERRADGELHEGLIAGDFCYVLTSRQMGKSSLMVRTVRRLRSEGRAVAVLDLTAIGQNLTVEQWYTGLLERAGSQLDLEDELEDFWDDHQKLGPAQRWFAAIREVVMTSAAAEKGVVIFVDEIDAVRSLPFSTDEFFAAIREFHNRRSAEADLSRLTFCLLGVATPSDLIRDTRTTPFNIGRRIELRDFAPSEAEGLLIGLESRFTREQARPFLERVMFWTNGQPYLTQLFCRSLVEREDISSVSNVDALCRTLFLDERAAEKNDNLVFVRERMLRSEVDRYELLALYDNVLRLKSVPDDPSNVLIGVLRLSGIVREENGLLWVRSPIYQRVFNRKWVAQNLPDAEVRRQRRAYRQGLIRSAVWATVILSFMVYSWINARHQAWRADESAASEATARKNAELAQSKAERAAAQVTAILNQMGLRQAEEMFEQGRSPTAVANLAHLLSNNPSNRLAAQRLVYALSQRNFPLHAKWSNQSGEVEKIIAPLTSDGPYQVSVSPADDTIALVFEKGSTNPIMDLQHDGFVWSVALSPDHRMVATGAMDDAARLWDLESGDLLLPPLKHSGPVIAARFSPDGKRLATASANRMVRVWDVSTGQPVTEPLAHNLSVRDIQFSRDGNMLFSRSGRGGGRGRGRGRTSLFSRAWDIRPGNLTAPPMRHDGRVQLVQFSADGRFIITSADDGKTRIWHAKSGLLAGEPIIHKGRVIALEVSPKVPEFITTTVTGQTKVWSLPDGLPIRTLPGEEDLTVSMRLSADGQRLLIARASGQVTIEPVRYEAFEPVVIHVPTRVARAEFDAQAKKVLTIGIDRSLRLWDAETGELLVEGFRFTGRYPIFGATFSPDGGRILTHAMNFGRIWSIYGEEISEAPLEHGSFIRHAGFDRDGRRVFTASMDRTIRIWDSSTGDPVGMSLLHPSAVVHAEVLEDNLRLLSTTMNHRCQLWDLVTGQPISEPFTSPHHHIYGTPRMDRHQTTRLSPDGQWLAMTTEDMVVRVWPILNPPVPVPDWLPQAAEQIAGERINDRGSLVNTDGRDLPRIRQRLEHAKGDGFYARWGRWLLSDRGDQTINPWSEVKRRDLPTHGSHSSQ